MAELFVGREGTSPKETITIPDEIRATTGRRYEVSDRIAAGGNGVVHRCIDMFDGTTHAVKFQLDLRENRLLRFEREKKLLSEVRHDHLILYEDHGDVLGELRTRGGHRRPRQVTIRFIVMMLADATLADLVKNSQIPTEIFLAQFRGLARALGELHKKAIHRDIKPENILVMGDRWVLSDYGLCDLHTSEGPGNEMTPDWEIVGPRFWMSPEANNRSIGLLDVINAASDVFQLASVFWFVINRSHPTGVLSREDWKGPDVLFSPIFRALHHNVAIRPLNGSEFADQIDTAVRG